MNIIFEFKHILFLKYFMLFLFTFYVLTTSTSCIEYMKIIPNTYYNIEIKMEKPSSILDNMIDMTLNTESLNNDNLRVEFVILTNLSDNECLFKYTSNYLPSINNKASKQLLIEDIHNNNDPIKFTLEYKINFENIDINKLNNVYFIVLINEKFPTFNNKIISSNYIGSNFNSSSDDNISIFSLVFNNKINKFSSADVELMILDIDHSDKKMINYELTDIINELICYSTSLNEIKKNNIITKSLSVKGYLYLELTDLFKNSITDFETYHCDLIIKKDKAKYVKSLKYNFVVHEYITNNNLIKDLTGDNCEKNDIYNEKNVYRHMFLSNYKLKIFKQYLYPKNSSNENYIINSAFVKIRNNNKFLNVDEYKLYYNSIDNNKNIDNTVYNNNNFDINNLTLFRDFDISKNYNDVKFNIDYINNYVSQIIVTEFDDENQSNLDTTFINNYIEIRFKYLIYEMNYETQILNYHYTTLSNNDAKLIKLNNLDISNEANNYYLYCIINPSSFNIDLFKFNEDKYYISVRLVYKYDTNLDRKDKKILKTNNDDSNFYNTIEEQILLNNIFNEQSLLDNNNYLAKFLLTKDIINNIIYSNKNNLYVYFKLLNISNKEEQSMNINIPIYYNILIKRDIILFTNINIKKPYTRLNIDISYNQRAIIIANIKMVKSIFSNKDFKIAKIIDSLTNRNHMSFTSYYSVPIYDYTKTIDDYILDIKLDKNIKKEVVEDFSSNKNKSLISFIENNSTHVFILESKIINSNISYNFLLEKVEESNSEINIDTNKTQLLLLKNNNKININFNNNFKTKEFKIFITKLDTKNSIVKLNYNENSESKEVIIDNNDINSLILNNNDNENSLSLTLNKNNNNIDNNTSQESYVLINSSNLLLLDNNYNKISDTKFYKVAQLKYSKNEELNRIICLAYLNIDKFNNGIKSFNYNVYGDNNVIDDNNNTFAIPTFDNDENLSIQFNSNIYYKYSSDVRNNSNRNFNFEYSINNYNKASTYKNFYVSFLYELYSDPTSDNKSEEVINNSLLKISYDNIPILKKEPNFYNINLNYNKDKAGLKLYIEKRELKQFYIILHLHAPYEVNSYKIESPYFEGFDNDYKTFNNKYNSLSIYLKLNFYKIDNCMSEFVYINIMFNTIQNRSDFDNNNFVVNSSYTLLSNDIKDIFDYEINSSLTYSRLVLNKDNNILKYKIESPVYIEESNSLSQYLKDYEFKVYLISDKYSDLFNNNKCTTMNYLRLIDQKKYDKLIDNLSKKNQYYEGSIYIDENDINYEKALIVAQSKTTKNIIINMQNIIQSNCEIVDIFNIYSKSYLFTKENNKEEFCVEVELKNYEIKKILYKNVENLYLNIYSYSNIYDKKANSLNHKSEFYNIDLSESKLIINTEESKSFELSSNNHIINLTKHNSYSELESVKINFALRSNDVDNNNIIYGKIYYYLSVNYSSEYKHIITPKVTNINFFDNLEFYYDNSNSTPTDHIIKLQNNFIIANILPKKGNISLSIISLDKNYNNLTYENNYKIIKENKELYNNELNPINLDYSEDTLNDYYLKFKFNNNVHNSNNNELSVANDLDSFSLMNLNYNLIVVDNIEEDMSFNVKDYSNNLKEYVYIILDIDSLIKYNKYYVLDLIYNQYSVYLIDFSKTTVNFSKYVIDHSNVLNNYNKFHKEEFNNINNNKEINIEEYAIITNYGVYFDICDNKKENIKAYGYNTIMLKFKLNNNIPSTLLNYKDSNISIKFFEVNEYSMLNNENKIQSINICLDKNNKYFVIEDRDVLINSDNLYIYNFVENNKNMNNLYDIRISYKYPSRNVLFNIPEDKKSIEQYVNNYSNINRFIDNEDAIFKSNDQMLTVNIDKTKLNLSAKIFVSIVCLINPFQYFNDFIIKFEMFAPDIYNTNKLSIATNSIQNSSNTLNNYKVKYNYYSILHTKEVTHQYDLFYLESEILYIDLKTQDNISDEYITSFYSDYNVKTKNYNNKDVLVCYEIIKDKLKLPTYKEREEVEFLNYVPKNNSNNNNNDINSTCTILNKNDFYFITKVNYDKNTTDVVSNNILKIIFKCQIDQGCYGHVLFNRLITNINNIRYNNQATIKYQFKSDEKYSILLPNYINNNKLQKQVENFRYSIRVLKGNLKLFKLLNEDLNDFYIISQTSEYSNDVNNNNTSTTIEHENLSNYFNIYIDISKPEMKEIKYLQVSNGSNNNNEKNNYNDNKDLSVIFEIKYDFVAIQDKKIIDNITHTKDNEIVNIQLNNEDDNDDNYFYNTNYSIFPIKESDNFYNLIEYEMKAIDNYNYHTFFNNLSYIIVKDTTKYDYNNYLYCNLNLMNNQFTNINVQLKYFHVFKQIKQGNYLLIIKHSLRKSIANDNNYQDKKLLNVQFKYINNNLEPINLKKDNIQNNKFNGSESKLFIVNNNIDDYNANNNSSLLSVNENSNNFSKFIHVYKSLSLKTQEVCYINIKSDIHTVNNNYSLNSIVLLNTYKSQSYKLSDNAVSYIFIKCNFSKDTFDNRIILEYVMLPNIYNEQNLNNNNSDILVNANIKKYSLALRKYNDSIKYDISTKRINSNKILSNVETSNIIYDIYVCNNNHNNNTYLITLVDFILYKKELKNRAIYAFNNVRTNSDVEFEIKRNSGKYIIFSFAQDLTSHRYYELYSLSFSSNSDDTDSGDNNIKSISKGIIALIIILSLLAIIAIIVLIKWMCRRYKNKNNNYNTYQNEINTEIVNVKSSLISNN